MSRIAAGQSLPEEERQARTEKLVADRVPDLRFLLDSLLEGAGGVADVIDVSRIGLAGWSFGGWAVLATPEVDDRIGAILALAPGGASQPVAGVIPVTLSFAWRRAVPTLYLAAKDDIWTLVEGIQELHGRTPAPRQMFTLRHSGHLHFGDVIEEEGGCSTQQAHDFNRGLGLAHFDAVLKGNAAAASWLAGDVVSKLRQRGVEAIAEEAEMTGA